MSPLVKESLLRKRKRDTIIALHALMHPKILFGSQCWAYLISISRWLAPKMTIVLWVKNDRILKKVYYDSNFMMYLYTCWRIWDGFSLLLQWLWRHKLPSICILFCVSFVGFVDGLLVLLFTKKAHRGSVGVRRQKTDVFDERAGTCSRILFSATRYRYLINRVSPFFSCSCVGQLNYDTVVTGASTRAIHK